MADTEAALDFIASQDAGFYRVEKLYDDWTMYSDALVEGYAGINNYNSSIDSDLAEFYQLVWPDALDGGNTSLQRHCLSQSDDGLMSLLGVKYLLSKEPVDYPGFTRMTQVGDVTVYRNDNASSVLYAAESTISESELEAAGDPATRQAMLEHNIFVPDERHRGAEGTSASECTDLRLTGSSDLRGTLTCENSSIACLTVPYTSGWQVTVDGQSHPIPQPFCVIATQNPTGAAGTQLLPDSQVDRFALRIRLGYPAPREEAAMIKNRQGANPLENVRSVVTRQRFLALQETVDATFLSDSVIDYVVALCDATRKQELFARGASPRATLSVAAMAKSIAQLRGRDYVVPGDVKEVFIPTLAHRMILTGRAESQGKTPEQVLKSILDATPAPRLR